MFDKVIDIILGLFLIMTGLFLLLMYVCLHAKADNVLIAFSMILFLLVLGIVSIVLGVRRIFSTLKKM